MDQRRILLGLLILGVLYTLYFARDLLYPVFIALFLAMLFHPVVDGLRRFKIPGVIGAALVVSVLLLVLITGFMQLSEPAAEWLDNSPRILREAEHKLTALKKKVREARKTTEQLKEMTDVDPEKQEKVVVEGPSMASKVIGQAGTFGLSFFMVIIMLYLFLAKGGAFLAQLAGRLRSKAHYLEAMHDIRHEIARYLLTISIINFVLGGVTAVMIAFLGLPNPVLWGVSAGILNFIPYLGGIVTTSILALISFIAFDSWVNILLPPLLFVLFNGLEGFVITPIILGRRFRISPVVIILSLFFWGWIWGIIGMFLAMPILVTIDIMMAKINFLPDETTRIHGMTDRLRPGEHSPGISVITGASIIQSPKAQG